MESRSSTSVRLMFVALLLSALVVCHGVGALIAAGPANAGPTAGSFAPLQSLQALLAVQQTQLTAADGAAGDEFGYSVALFGDTALVGAIYNGVGANSDQGSAYVFVRSGTSWALQQKLTAADGAAGDEFGYSVAVSGDTALVGAVGDAVGSNTAQGSAYVFVRSGSTWSQQAQLTAADGAAGDQFGYSVAVSGDTALVGTALDDVASNELQGSAYVFVRSGSTWSQQAKLTAADGAANDRFGGSVALSGETALVGAEYHAVASTTPGSAYVFVRSGTTWSQQAQLTAADGAYGDSFGRSVALCGDTALVGAPYHFHSYGSAYVFVRSGTTWSQQAELGYGGGNTGDLFGCSVALDGDVALVGSWQRYDFFEDRTCPGSAYVFVRSGSTWSQRVRLTAAGIDIATEHPVALSGDTALVGAAYDTVGANQTQGMARVFTDVMGVPGKPTAKSPKGLISSRTPTFKWTAATGAATYEVRVYKGVTLIKKMTGITKLSWKCTKLLPRKVYLTWKTRARNVAGYGVWSGKLRFKVR